jgi:hypothetical protein
VSVLLALPGGVGERPLPLRSESPATAALMGLVGDEQGSRLVQVDPSTLATVHASARVGYYDGWVRSPDGKLLVVATHSPRDTGAQVSTIRFVNTGTLKFVRTGVRLDGFFRAALWPSLGRLLALTGSCCNSDLELATVDTVAKRVVARRTIPGVVLDIVRSADGLVLLAAPPNEIGPARLVAVEGDGSVRTVALDRIQAGSHWPEESTQDPIGTMREPGLAVDPKGGVAYVVDPAGLVAAVRLADRGVTYHTAVAAQSLLGRLSHWLTPVASAKGMNGPIRTAVWLGDGMLAVTGSDSSALRRKDGTMVISGRPAGLSVIDTRDWTARTIDAGADAATVADGVLLTTGGTFRVEGSTNTTTGEGIVARGPNGSVRWRLFPGTAAWVVGAHGDRAVVQQNGGQTFDLVDLETGKVLRSLGSTYPWLLLGSGSAS